MAPKIEDILEFWFGGPPANQNEIGRHMRRWFGSDDEMDAVFARRYGVLMTRASAGELDRWGDSARGRLALILLLDQFPRNTFRGDSAAFAQDSLALSWALDGLSRGLHLELETLERLFFYMPMQHSESLEIQQRPVEAFVDLVRADSPEFLVKFLVDSAEFIRISLKDSAVSRTVIPFWAESRRLMRQIISRKGRRRLASSSVISRVPATLAGSMP
jgi:uncharacterized protein (DUF924 family)